MPASNYGIRPSLKGPPGVTPWWSHNERRGGCPCVIKRKLGYVITRLSDLSKWENLYHVEAEKPEDARHPLALEHLKMRIDNKEQWLDYSVETLRGAVRFALARIESSSEDHQIMLDLRAAAGMPFKHATGRTNARWHNELRYYSDVLEQYLIAKTAVSKTSRSSAAMEELWDLCGNAVNTFKANSGREVDDAMQQAALGIMRAASKFDPGHGGLAKFRTYASHWIRRMTQVRKTDDCKPGQIMVGGKIKSVKNIEISSEDDGRSDQFHPETDNTDVGVRFDVSQALAQLSEADRSLVERRLVHGESLAVISEATGISVGKLKTRIDFLTERLQNSLRNYSPD